jgi:prophage tail gpP-like protein
MDKVKLLINGSTFEGWKSVSIKRNLKSVCGSFSLAVTDSWNYQSQPWRLRPGDACEVFIGSERMLTGYIDDGEPSFSAKDKAIAISGRDKAGDLVDCSADTKEIEYRGLKAERIAAILCQPFGIKVRCDIDTGPALDIWTIQKSESVAENLAKLAKRSGALVISESSGDILITRNGRVRSSSVIAEGQNMLTGSAKYSHQNRYSRYKVLTNTNGSGLSDSSDSEAGSFIAGLEAIAVDSTVKRYRPLIVIADSEMNQELVKKRANWERNVRAAQATQVSLSVQGWRQADGRLWSMNELVKIKAPWLGLDMDMLTTSVDFSLSESGTITSLELEPPDAYRPEPVDAESKVWKELTPKNAVRNS